MQSLRGCPRVLQLLNAIRYMRSASGQRVLQPPLSELEVPELAAMEQSLVHVKRQYFALANRLKPPVKSPEELMAAGLEPGGEPGEDQEPRAALHYY